jgi:hypothetical protein
MRVKDLGSGSAPGKHSFIKNSRHRKAPPLNSIHTKFIQHFLFFIPVKSRKAPYPESRTQLRLVESEHL